MQDFLRLNPYTEDVQPMTGPVAEYLRSGAFRASVTQIQEDPRAMARLTLALLENMSLDPLVGSKLEDFVKYAGPDYELEKLKATSDSIWFCLQFNRMSNFVGSFTIPRSAPETELLLKAVRDNLDSRMFKAAKMHRRLERKSSRRYRRMDKLGSAAHSAVMAQATNEKYVKAFRGCSDYDMAAQALRDELYDTARTAYSGIYEPLRKRMEGRISAVAKAAFGPDFRNGLTEILTAFAIQHIVPIQPRQATQSL